MSFVIFQIMAAIESQLTHENTSVADGAFLKTGLVLNDCRSRSRCAVYLKTDGTTGQPDR